MVIYLLTVDSLATAYTFGLMWGLFTGTAGVFEQMLLAQYFGRNSFGTITGVLTPLSMGALGIGPFLGAGIRETTGSYSQLFLALAVVYLIAAFLIYNVRPPAPPRRELVGVSGQ